MRHHRYHFFLRDEFLKTIANGESDVVQEDNERELYSLENTTEGEFAEIEELIERVKDTIADASRKNANNSELKQTIHAVLKEYPSVKYSPLRTSVNELIITECQKYGLAALKERGADELWVTGV